MGGEYQSSTRSIEMFLNVMIPVMASPFINGADQVKPVFFQNEIGPVIDRPLYQYDPIWDAVEYTLCKTKVPYLF